MTASAILPVRVSGEEEEGVSSVVGVRDSVVLVRSAASASRMRSSSAVTRDWTWSSRLRERTESVCILGFGLA